MSFDPEVSSGSQYRFFFKDDLALRSVFVLSSVFDLRSVFVLSLVFDLKSVFVLSLVLDLRSVLL